MIVDWITPAAALVGVAIGALATYSLGQRNLTAQYVIAERKLWREKLRCVLQQLLEHPGKDTAAKVSLVLHLNTNPFHQQDRQIVDLAAGICDPANQNQEFQELSIRMALLLKHDWERAKAETQPFSSAPRRWTYDEYLQWLNKQPHGKKLASPIDQTVLLAPD